jgi:WD40 repeat protein
MRISPDGKLLATPLPRSGEILIRDSTATKEVRRLNHPKAESVRFSPDGKLLLSHWSHHDRDTGRITTGARVWTLADGRVVFEPAWEKDEYCRWETFTRDGRLMMATNKPRLRTWNPRDGSDTSVILEGERIGFYSIDDAGSRLLHYGTGEIQTLDVKTGKVLHTFTGPGVGEEAAWLRPDGSEVVTATTDGRVVMFDAATGRLRNAFAVIGVVKEQPPSVSPGPDPRWFVVYRHAFRDNDVRLDRWVAIYTRDGRRVREDRDVMAVAFDPARRSVAVRTDVPTGPDELPRTTVTIHDAAVWLAGGAKKD